MYLPQYNQLGTALDNVHIMYLQNIYPITYNQHLENYPILLFSSLVFDQNITK